MAWTLSGRANGQLRPDGGDTFDDCRTTLKAKSLAPFSPRLWSALAVVTIAIALSLDIPMMATDGILSPWHYHWTTTTLDSAYAYAPWLAMCASTTAFAFAGTWKAPSTYIQPQQPDLERPGLPPTLQPAQQSFSAQDRISAPPASCETSFVGLVAQISHDLRTPLNAIIGFSDIMQRELLGPLGSNRYSDYAEHIRQSGFSLLKSVEDTLAMTRLLVDRADAATAPRDTRTAQLGDLIDDASTLVGSEARRRGITIVPPTSNDDKYVQGNPQALRQALVNVLTTCLETTIGESCISIATAHTDHHAQIMLTFSMKPTAGAANLAANLPWKIAGLLIELQGGTITPSFSDHECRITLALVATSQNVN